MPLHKYRSVSQMPSPRRVRPEELEDAIRAVWQRAMLLCPPCIKPGLQRFSSIEEANRSRQAEVEQRMKATAQPQPPDPTRP